jgi:acetylornithine deacetylase/succinyl-diaminopimelate desuccinylase-like protein
MQVEVEGPNRDLHSGTHGGAVQNPIHVLAELIAHLHDDNGAVSIPGFYDDVVPLSAEERRAFRQLPWSDEDFARDLGLQELSGENGFSTLERLWARPTLDCNGISGGFTAEGMMSIIPSRASAKISMRLVPNQKPAEIARLFEDHVRSITPRTVRVSVKQLAAADPAITSLSSPGMRAAQFALEKAFGTKPLLQRDGGSIPVITLIKQILGADTVLLGFGLPEENAHAPNEFLKLDHFRRGVRATAWFYQHLAEALRPAHSDT